MEGGASPPRECLGLEAKRGSFNGGKE